MRWLLARASCHLEIYQQWRTSAHSQAVTDPLFSRILPQAARDLGERGVGFCLTCRPLDVEVSLYYRSISELAAQAAGIKPSPAREIASDRLRLLPDGRVEKLVTN